MNQNLNNFFKNIKMILSDTETQKPKNIKEENIFKDLNIEQTNFISGNPNVIIKDEVKTNIIYLTTDCNLRCEYCYEEESRKNLEEQKDCNESGIDEFIEEIYNREKDNNSCIVVMGGEPLLRIDLLEYLAKKLISKPKNGSWTLNLITNGTLFSSKNINKIKEISNILKDSGNCFSIDVSFDASGHYRRKFPNGSPSKEIVEKNILKLKKNEIIFRISYTIHKGNYQNLLEDCIYIITTFKPERLYVSVGYQELDEVLGNGQSFKVREKFRPYAEYLFSLYKIPICGVTCNVCKKCNMSSSGLLYYSPTIGFKHQPRNTIGDFSGFTKNV